MSFIRINNTRLRIASIFAFCRMNDDVTDLESLSPRARAHVEKIRYSLKVFYSSDNKRSDELCAFPTEAALEEALAKLDKALPHFFHEKGWRLSLSTVLAVAPAVEHEQDPGVALLYPAGGICLDESDPEKLEALFARLDAALEVL